MKNTLTTFKALLALAALAWHTAVAEPPPPPTIADPLTLVSPCDQWNALSKLVALQIAMITGERGTTVTAATADDLLDKIKAQMLEVQGELIECWSAEVAYSISQRDNRSTPGAAQAQRYTAAIDKVSGTVTNLLTQGDLLGTQNGFDATLNQSLGAFYKHWYSELLGHENVFGVKGLHDRLRETFAELVQISVDCRVANRTTGATECPALTRRLNDVNAKLGARVVDAVSRVADLTKQMSADQKTADDAAAQIQNVASVLQQDQQALQGATYYIQTYSGYAQYFLSMYQYSVNWAYYFAYYGYWNWYSAYINAAYWYAGAYRDTVYWLVYWQTAAAQLQQQMAQLQGALQGLQMKAVTAMASVESDKGIIMALPIASMATNDPFDVGLDFGGAWGYANGSVAANPATGNGSCPAGYTAGQVLGTPKVDSPVFDCYRVKASAQEPALDFGGFYGYRDGRATPNPVSGTFGCPSGFTASTLLDTTGVDWPLAVCTRPHVSGTPEVITFGGMFGYVTGGGGPSGGVGPDGGPRPIVNPATHAMTCATGFTTGSVYGTKGTDYPIYFCYRANRI